MQPGDRYGPRNLPVRHYDGGIAALLTRDGYERRTIECAPDGINFEIKSVIKGAPHAIGLNRTLDQSFSLKGLSWRLEAWRTGVPFHQIVLRNTLIYRVEQVFLIHRDSGLLIQHLARADVETQDADAAQLRDQLRQAACTWDEHGRSDDTLWSGAAYREFASWRERYPGGLSETEKAFADAMARHAARRTRRRRAGRRRAGATGLPRQTF